MGSKRNIKDTPGIPMRVRKENAFANPAHGIEGVEWERRQGVESLLLELVDIGPSGIAAVDVGSPLLIEAEGQDLVAKTFGGTLVGRFRPQDALAVRTRAGAVATVRALSKEAPYRCQVVVE